MITYIGLLSRIHGLDSYFIIWFDWMYNCWHRYKCQPFSSLVLLMVRIPQEWLTIYSWHQWLTNLL